MVWPTFPQSPRISWPEFRKSGEVPSMSSPSASPRGTETRSDDLQQDPGQAAQEDRASQFERQVSQSDGVLKPKTIFSLLKTASSEWSKDNVPRMGAALAYYTIFSLAPLLVIAIAVAGLAFGAKEKMV